MGKKKDRKGDRMWRGEGIKTRLGKGIYILPKGGHQESNLEVTIIEDGDPH
jgi:hypothetical protein